MLEIGYKKLNARAVTPFYAKDGDAGMDIVSTRVIDEDDESITYGTDLSFEIPNGYVGLLFPRSSVRKYGLVLSNCVGVIDSGYRGEIMCNFKKTGNLLNKIASFLFGKKSNLTSKYEVGERMCQIVFIQLPKVLLKEKNSLSDSERGSGGFGHSGK